MILRECPAADAQWIRLSRRPRRTAARFSSRRCRRRMIDKTVGHATKAIAGNSRLTTTKAFTEVAMRDAKSQKSNAEPNATNSPFRLIGRRWLTRLIYEGSHSIHSTGASCPPLPRATFSRPPSNTAYVTFGSASALRLFPPALASAFGHARHPDERERARAVPRRGTIRCCRR